MLRMLESANHTYIICTLIDMLTKYHSNQNYPKLPNLIVKCLMKISKIVEKLIDSVDTGKVLLSMHEYLLVINHDAKTPNDEMGIKAAKTMLNEFIKIKRDNIWQDYAVVKQHHIPDQHLYKWI